MRIINSEYAIILNHRVKQNCLPARRMEPEGLHLLQALQAAAFLSVRFTGACEWLGVILARCGEVAEPGLRRTPGERVDSEGSRGFKSLPLRQALM
jgi:hypothetical protein